jgi:phosphoribosylaminoimidazole-succinocarboxamide synthase
VPALPHIASGKVREIYEVDTERLLFVATDRISAYDVILNQAIPDKGRVLTGLSLHFFELLDTPNHLLTMDLSSVPGISDDDRMELSGRSMVVRRAEVVPVECVVRGYLYGSSWREYRDGGGPTTEHLPPGLVLADRLPEPIFTPATKAQQGHDENISFDDACKLVGTESMRLLRERSIELYVTAAEHAIQRGIIIADTKFEWGLRGGKHLLIDEVLTPDSSRFWPADRYEPGRDQESFDKQYVRNYLTTLVEAGTWDKAPPGPELPEEIVRNTAAKYAEALTRLTE